MVTGLGKSVHEGVGCTVVELADDRHKRADRREQDEEIQRLVFKQLVQNKRSLYFRQQCFFDFFPGEVLNHASPGNSCGMDHTVDGAKLVFSQVNGFLHVIAVGDIGFEKQKPGAGFLQLFDLACVPAGISPGQHHPGPVLTGKILCYFKAQSSLSAGYQVNALFPELQCR